MPDIQALDMAVNRVSRGESILIPELAYYKIRAARAEMQLASVQAKQLEAAFTALVQQEVGALLPDGHRLDDYTLNLETRTLALRGAQEVAPG